MTSLARITDLENQGLPYILALTIAINEEGEH